MLCRKYTSNEKTRQGEIWRKHFTFMTKRDNMPCENIKTNRCPGPDGAGVKREVG